MVLNCIVLVLLKLSFILDRYASRQNSILMMEKNWSLQK